LFSGAGPVSFNKELTVRGGDCFNRAGLKSLLALKGFLTSTPDETWTSFDSLNGLAGRMQIRVFLCAPLNSSRFAGHHYQSPASHWIVRFGQLI
jgi:hypothetical protein